MTNLEVTLDADGPGGKPAESAPLVCVSGDPQGDGRQSTFEDCDAVAELPDDFASPTSPDTACTEIFGGPDVVTLKGVFHGENLDTKLTRADGCEIDRFDPFAPILQKLFPGYEPGASIGA